MPRTKGSKNRPKTNITKDYASQIAEKQESITSLTAEIEYSRAVTPQIRQAGNRLSGLAETAYASLLA